MIDIDEQIRMKAFEWLKGQEILHPDFLPRRLLEKGFEFKGEMIPLVAPQGIFKPRYLDVPLSITTAPNGPYQDTFGADRHLLLYKYRGSDFSHRDNAGLRRAMVEGKPLIYFFGVAPGRYIASYPVYIIGDDPASLTFKVAVDDVVSLNSNKADGVAEAGDGRRAYITAIVRQRLHQRSFRERVLYAYREQCALCRLRHYELLDAAHIIPDTEPEGVAHVYNGIALCKLHHAAFDGLLLGITPDYTVQIRGDVLDEIDGPLLEHGLKELHETKILLPHDKQSWPSREALDMRYQQFKKAS